MFSFNFCPVALMLGLGFVYTACDPCEIYSEFLHRPTEFGSRYYFSAVNSCGSARIIILLSGVEGD